MILFDRPWTEEVVSETKTQVSRGDEPYIVHSVIRTVLTKQWNKGYNQDALCNCGHPYYRHFDTYEEMYPIGCKYCDCHNFTPKE